MRTRPTLLACLLFGLVFSPAAHPCSSFALAQEHEVLLAKNFDWHFGGGYLVKNPRGVARRALPLFDGEPAGWTSLHGSLTFTQYGVGLPYGGINERGLAIEMLWLDETVYPSSAPQTIGELEWIQYHLDTCATVAEVVARLNAFSIRPIGGKIHYMLVDASGDRALVEFVDGETRVHRGGEQPLVCTNDTRTLSELAFAKIRSSKLEGSSSRVRYARLTLELVDSVGPASVEGGFAALATVAVRGARYRTQWSSIYEIRKRRIHVKPDGTKGFFTIDASALDYAQGSGTTFQELFGKKLSGTRFAPLTVSASRDLLGRNLPKVGLNSQLDAIATHLLSPSTSAVRPLDDRATLTVRVHTSAPGAFARIAVFRNQRELSGQRAEYAGSVLLDSAQREFAFYNLPKGRYAVGAFHDLDQDGRPGDQEPVVFHRPDPSAAGDSFAELAFELKEPQLLIELAVD